MKTFLVKGRRKIVAHHEFEFTIEAESAAVVQRLFDRGDPLVRDSIDETCDTCNLFDNIDDEELDSINSIEEYNVQPVVYTDGE